MVETIIYLNNYLLVHIMADYREQILVMAQEKPLLPGDVAKALNTNLIMASAMLSELSASKKLRVSRLKVGSSPLYFVPEKEAQLENYVGSLNEKDRKTVELLKLSKVLRDKVQEPLTRVSLRQISDFSRPVEIKHGEGAELFWKWYLLPDSEAEFLIKNIVEPKVVAQQQLSQAPASQAPALTFPKSIEKKPTKINFMSKVISFFESNKINVVEKVSSLKQSFCFVVEMPSPVGVVTFYCLAHNKKKVSDADVSNVFVQAQLRKLPALLVSEGELSKSARELLQQLKGVLFQRI